MLSALQEGAGATQHEQESPLIRNGHHQAELTGESTYTIASSLLSSEEGTDIDSPSFHSNLSGVTPSTAARAREKQLRGDHMAIVLDPLHVDCKGCGKRIKLSTKSLYDLSHWRTHRARCLKRQPHLKKPSSKPDMMQLGTSEPSLRRSEKPSTPLNSPDVDQSRVAAAIKNQPSLSHSSMSTPPLTPPGVDATVIKEHNASTLLLESSVTSHLSTALPLSPSNVEERRTGISNSCHDHPSSLPKSPTCYPLPADIVFADYLLRSNRQMVLSTTNIQPRWQDWTWARLRLPQFQALDHGAYRDTLFSPNDAALSLSLLARS